jgi:hypothetical protein
MTDQMTDCMTDLETTGTDPAHAAIIQIAAVKFNFKTGEIGEVFNRCLSIAPRRYWDEETRKWWQGQNRDVFNSIVDRMEAPEPVFRDFVRFASEGAPNGGYRLWAKPISFEFGFIQSYANQFGLPMPFHFRIARDLNTYIAAQAGGADHHDMDHIEMAGNAHDALADVVHQLKMLFAARDGNLGIVNAEFTEILA